MCEFCYVGEEQPLSRNLDRVIGTNEALLNSAIHAHGKGYVRDWLRFLRSEWSRAVVHDKFHLLLQGLKEVLTNDKFAIVIVERVLERAESTVDNMLVGEFRKEIVGHHGELIAEGTLKSIAHEVTEFLRKYRSELPGFLPSK